MKIMIGSIEIECEKAVKYANKVIVTKDGVNITYGGILDFSRITLVDGEWTNPEPTETEKLKADIEYLSAMTGVIL